MSYDYQDPLDAAPEDMKPDGAVVQLVGIIRHGEFNYYVLPRNLVYLDASKGADGALEAGLEGRYGIETVDEAHEDEFFQVIEPYKRSSRRLYTEFCNSKTWPEYFVEVLIDFDRKHFASYSSEPYFFEDHVPDGWTSEYGGIGCDPHYFLRDRDEVDDGLGIGGLAQDYIPMEHHFWIDENGKSVFKRKIEAFEERKKNERKNHHTAGDIPKR